MHRLLLCLALVPLLASGVFAQVAPVPSLLNFQGRLAKPDGTPVSNGTYSLRFSLWDAASNGTEKWNQTVNPVNVKNGTFAVLLSGFVAGTFNGNLWLEIKVGTAASLTPRQQLVSVAYAMKANTVPDGAIGAAQIADGSITAGKFASNTLNPLAWLLGGNSGTTASHFLGTTDNKPLVIKANNRQVMRYEDKTDAANTYHTVNVLGGSSVNNIESGVVGATIAGGGQDNNSGVDSPNDIRGNFGFIGGGSGNFIDAFLFATIGGGVGNIVQGDYAVIAGGSGNNVQSAYSVIGGGTGNYLFGLYATIAGGQTNQVTAPFAAIGGGYNNLASGADAAIGGGSGNQATNNFAAIGGGNGNVVTGAGGTIGGGGFNTASGSYATIGGGIGNNAKNDTDTIAGGNTNEADGPRATVGGGDHNQARGSYATVAGGYTNYALNSSSSVGGGYRNWAVADYSTIPGGYLNNAYGVGSFAAGVRASANYSGSFVWADNRNEDFSSTAVNQFCIRAYGGVILETGGDAFLYTASTAGEKNRYFDLYNSPLTQTASGLKAGGILCADSFGYANPGKNDLIVKGSVGIGYAVPTSYRLAVAGDIFATGGYYGSDVRYKQNITTFPNALDAVLALRGVTFDWKKNDFKEMNFRDGKQIGFIAQEVEKVLPELVSTDGKGYKSVAYQNIVPVLVEAMKQQQKQIESLKAEHKRITALEAQVKQMDALKAQLATLTARLTQVEAAKAARK